MPDPAADEWRGYFREVGQRAWRLVAQGATRGECWARLLRFQTAARQVEKVVRHKSQGEPQR